MRAWLALACLLLAARPLAAQVQTPNAVGAGGGGGGAVAQGTAAATSDAAAWPMKIVFGSAQVDPRDISDRLARALGKITFDGAQPVTQSGTWTVSGTFWQATQPISAASLPLPSGAATSAKQPALGTAGSASSDVVTVQGIASMTPLKVDGSAVTQPVSGTVSVGNFPTSANTSAVSVRCVNAAGNAFESCAGGGGAGSDVNLTGIAGVTPSVGNGASGTGVQRVTIASDSTGQVTLAAGTNAIGKLTANSGVTIGDINVVSSIPGTGATSLGKAEDGTHTTADTGVATLAVRNDGGSTQATSANGDYGNFAIDAYGAQYTRIDHPNRINCTADNIAATLTQLTGCGQPGASLSIYITNVIVVSTTTTAGTAQLRSGTGTNCGTGTVAVWPVVSTSRTFGVPANNAAAGPLTIPFYTPYKLTANHALCVIGAATNTTNILVMGFIAP